MSQLTDSMEGQLKQPGEKQALAERRGDALVVTRSDQIARSLALGVALVVGLAIGLLFLRRSTPALPTLVGEPSGRYDEHGELPA